MVAGAKLVVMTVSIVEKEKEKNCNGRRGPVSHNGNEHRRKRRRKFVMVVGAKLVVMAMGIVEKNVLQKS